MRVTKLKNLGTFEHGGNIHQILRQSGTTDTKLIDFSANINPLGLSKQVLASIEKALPQIIHYPDPEGTDLKAAIAAHYEVAVEGITLGNGAVELLYLLCHVLKPKQALILAPSFSEYERAARSVNAVVEYHYLMEQHQFEIHLDALIPKLAKQDILFIGNPNNPTGTLLTNTDLEKLLQAAEKEQCFVVIDESFIDFIENSAQYTCRVLTQKYRYLVVLHSLTKFYAIPGLRLGFALASEAMTAKLHFSKDPWNVNLLAQKAGVAALFDFDYQRSTRAFIKAEKLDFYHQLQEIAGLTVYPSTVNFVLVDVIGTFWNATQLKHALLKQDILIRDCSNYPGLSTSFVRFAVKTHAENQTLIKKMKKMIMEGKND